MSEENRRTWTGLPRRRWRALTVFLLFALIAPSLPSRLLAPLRRVRSVEVQQHERADFPDQQIRLAIYNIAHGRGLVESNWDGGTSEERRNRLDAIATELKSWNADIVVLNEVDFECTWSSKVDQAVYLARKAGFRYVYEQRNVDARFLTYTWRFGNAVLSKFPCQSAEAISYPTFVQWESIIAGQKHGMICEFGDAENSFSLAAVHLESRDEATRQRSARLLCRDKPTILAGDFNSAPADFPAHENDVDGHNAIAVIDQLENYRRQPKALPQSHQLTFPSNAPDRVIDWIIIEKGIAFGSYKVVDCRHSDHKPVVADVLLVDAAIEFGGSQESSGPLGETAAPNTPTDPDGHDGS